MLDPLSGKDNKKTGWLRRAIDVAEGVHSSSSYVLNGKDAGPSYWKHDEDTFHMDNSGVLSNKGVLTKKATGIAFDQPTSMEGYKNGYLYFISTSYDASYKKTGLLKPYLHLVSYDTQKKNASKDTDLAFFLTQSYAQAASGTENCKLAKAKKAKKGAYTSNYYEVGECFTYPGDPTANKDFYHGALGVNENSNLLYFTTEHTHLVFNLNSHKDSSSGLFFKIQIEISNLVIINAVKTDVIIPIDNVTANPLTGPVPRKNKTRDAINVVTFASSIVPRDLVYPDSTADIGFFSLLISSLILSKIITLASTAIPIVNTIPAIPGRVNVAWSNDKIPTIKIIFKINAKFA